MTNVRRVNAAAADNKQKVPIVKIVPHSKPFFPTRFFVDENMEKIKTQYGQKPEDTTGPFVKYFILMFFPCGV